MQQRLRLVPLIAAAVLLNAVVLSRPAPAQADPDFGDVDDILHGRRHMLRTDDLVVGYRLGRSLLLTQESTITNANARTLADGTNKFTWPTVVGARMFDMPSDVAVTLVEDNDFNILRWSLSRFPTSSTGDTIASGTVRLGGTIAGADPNTVLSVAVADLTDDGFDDVVVFLAKRLPGGTIVHAIVGTAADPEDPSKGLKFGPELELPELSIPPLAITTALVAGKPRVFVAGPANHFDSRCPSRYSGLGFESYAVDPNTLALTSQGKFFATLPDRQPACLHFADIATGQFTALRDQLVVTYGVEGGTVNVIPFDITAQGLAVQHSVFDTGAPTGIGQANIRAGRFDWRSSYDAAALLISNGASFPARIRSES
jgi:hypothetical protein